jgi:hypothetical protein
VTWELWGPYSGPFEAPQLDPEIADGLLGEPTFWQGEAEVIGLSDASYEDVLAVLPRSYNIQWLSEDVCFAKTGVDHAPE